MMHDKAMRAFCALSLGLVFGGFAACAGTDVPPTDDLEDQIATAYANGAGVAGGTGGSASTAGSGGRASAAGNGGAAGDGDDQAPAGGAAGSGGDSEEDPGAEPDCDGFAILQASCGSQGCHGPNSAVGNWAESLEDAETFIDSPPVTAGCGSVDSSLIDPANPGQSLLIQKVDGVPPCGGPMPLVGDKLTDAEISCLQEWIGSL